MEQYTNEHGRTCYRGVTEDSPFSRDLFYDVDMSYSLDNDTQVAFHSELGSITVLDRMTGFSGGIRDIETGYRDEKKRFWLASGSCDVRNSGATTVGEAIEWIKKFANNCVPSEEELAQ